MFAEADWLGTDTELQKDSFVAVFVPSQTRDGNPIDHEFWRREAVKALSELFGGATSVNAFGGWLDVEDGGKVKEEEISVVVSYIAKSEWDEVSALQLREFLYRMGRETQQGAIGLHVLGRYLEIKADKYE